MADVTYLAPRGLKEVLNAMKKWKGRAKVIAGGTNLIPYMRLGVLAPEVIIDLNGLEELAFIRDEGRTISIGALTAISALASSEMIRNESPLLFSAASGLGSPLTRNRATVGGNLADGSPAADMAPALLTLEASVHTKRGGGQGREIFLDEFFLGPHRTVLEEDEIITRITFLKPKDPARSSYIKLGLRNSMAISVVSIAVRLEMEKRVCRKARVALGAVAPKPIRAYNVEKNLEGRKIDQGIIKKCCAMVKEEISPISDIRASAEYRELATSVLLKRSIQEALKGGHA